MLYKYDSEEASRRQVDEEDLPGINKTIDTIIGMADKARMEGLLALEDDLESIEEPLLRLGISLVLDGTEPELIESTLLSALHAGEYRGAELVRRLIIIHGAMQVQAGTNPVLIKTILAAYLGEKAALEASLSDD